MRDFGSEVGKVMTGVLSPDFGRVPKPRINPLKRLEKTWLEGGWKPAGNRLATS